MPDRLRSLVSVATCCLFLSFGVAAFATEPMPPLLPEERAAWTSVGRINVSGFRSRASCTGTLIAADLVLTAAHCVSRAVGFGDPVHFVAGWNKGNFVAHRTSKLVKLHPLYDPSGESRATTADIALVWLNDPIESAISAPIPLYHGSNPNLTPDLIMGYHNRRPHVLNAHKSCGLLGQSPNGLIRYDCAVIAGNSGGPVLTKVPGGWAVSAVIIAQASVPGQAIAAPIDQWTLLNWRETLKSNQSLPHK